MSQGGWRRMKVSGRELLLVMVGAGLAYLSAQGLPASFHSLAAHAWSSIGNEARREHHLKSMIQHLQPLASDLRLASALRRLGSLHRRQRHYEAADRELQRALAIQERLYGADQPPMIPVLRELSQVFREQLRADDAERVARRAVEIGEAWGVKTRERARSLELLALTHADQGRLGEAEAEMRRSLALNEEALGTRHANVAMSLARLGSLLHKQGRLRPAELYLERACLVLTEAKPTGTSQRTRLASVLNDLGLVYRDQGRMGEARGALGSALAILESPGAEDLGQPVWLANAGTVLLAGGLADASVQRHPQAPVLASTLESAGPLIAAVHNNLGTVWASQGRYGEAKEHFELAMQLLAPDLPREHPVARAAAGNLAQAGSRTRTGP